MNKVEKRRNQEYKSRYGKLQILYYNIRIYKYYYTGRET